MSTHSGESFFGNHLERIKRAISRWWEAGPLDAREIDVVARDLNLSSTELASLMVTPSCSLTQLNQRLAYEGMTEQSLAASHPHELRDLRRVCSQCHSKARCARDLRHKRMATPSKYCPNEMTLRSLAREARNERPAQVLAFPATRS